MWSFSRHVPCRTGDSLYTAEKQSPGSVRWNLFCFDCRKKHALAGWKRGFGLELPTVLNLSVFTRFYTFKFVSENIFPIDVLAALDTHLCVNAFELCPSSCTYVSVPLCALRPGRPCGLPGFWRAVTAGGRDACFPSTVPTWSFPADHP